MIKIRVRGFQSIEDVSIDVEGFAALVGRSNIGKSAFVRAIECALTNPLGTAFVRHGESCSGKKKCDCFASVHIKTAELDLLWEKGESVNRYQVNGQVYDKPDKGMPSFLVEHGFGLVKAGDEISIQVADQYNPIFLLKQSGPAIAEAISDVAKLERINTATRLVEKDRRDTSATRKVREQDVGNLEIELNTYDGFDVALIQVGRAEQTLSLLDETADRVKKLGRYHEKLSVLKADVERLEDITSIKVPDSASMQDKKDAANELHRLFTSFTNKVREFKRYETASIKVPSIQAPEGIDTILNSVQTLSEWVVRLRRFKTELPLLTKLSTIEPPSMSGLPEQLSSVLKVRPHISKMQKLNTEIKALDVRSQELIREEAKLLREIDEIGVCPTCGNAVHGGGHHHAKAVVSV